MFGRGDRHAAYRIYTEDEFLGDEALFEDSLGDAWLEGPAGAAETAGESEARWLQNSAAQEQGPTSAAQERGPTCDVPAGQNHSRGLRSIGSRSAGVAALAAAVATVVGVVLLSELQSHGGSGGRRDLGGPTELDAAAGVPPSRALSPSRRGAPNVGPKTGVRVVQSLVGHTRRGQPHEIPRMAPAGDSLRRTKDAWRRAEDSPHRVAGSSDSAEDLPSLTADAGRPAPTSTAAPDGAPAIPRVAEALDGRTASWRTPEFGFER
jgi:hypothetical protein